MPIPVQAPSNATEASHLEAVIAALQALASPDTPQTEATAIQAGSLFSQLKSINRAATTETKTSKQRTTDARNAMDQAQLGLQNLMYERRHLEREIEKCQQFASIYQDIPLYTIEEFTTLAPEEARSEEVMNNEHQLMLNRLSFELSERQRLDERRKALLQDREQLLKQSKDYQVLIDGLGQQLDSLAKSSKEILKSMHDLAIR